MSKTRQFIAPLDILFLGSNKLFGTPGSRGESLVLPWPSVAAGALRSALLVHKGKNLSAFAQGEDPDEELGTPEDPGTFRLSNFQLARRYRDGRVDPLYPMPADLIPSKDSEQYRIRRIGTQDVPAGVLCSSATEQLPILSEATRSKPASGLWLTREGWQQYLNGEEIRDQHWVAQQDLWDVDFRVAIGLDPKIRSVAKGKLFSFDAIAFLKTEHEGEYDVGFLAETEGAAFPEQLMLRFGGEGRAALASTTPQLDMPEPDYDGIAQARKCRMILTTPGLFTRGWLPNGMTHGIQFELHGVRGRLCCAAVPRAEVVSGFDLAKGCPKPAQRIAPVGSVYWLQDLQADAAALRKLAEGGLWGEKVENTQRRAEGFNCLSFATY